MRCARQEPPERRAQPAHHYYTNHSNHLGKLAVLQYARTTNRHSPHLIFKNDKISYHFKEIFMNCMKALFRKLSNEIIRICSQSISLRDIFDGKVKESIETLNQCIECCVKWKMIYRKTALSQHKYSEKGWVLDQSSIFAQVDAFVQRCRDLIEVCNCQIHFARWGDGGKTKMPILGGQRGPEITRSLLEIEETFNKNLNILVKVGVCERTLLRGF